MGIYFDTSQSQTRQSVSLRDSYSDDTESPRRPCSGISSYGFCLTVFYSMFGNNGFYSSTL